MHSIQLQIIELCNEIRQSLSFQFSVFRVQLQKKSREILLKIHPSSRLYHLIFLDMFEGFEGFYALKLNDTKEKRGSCRVPVSQRIYIRHRIIRPIAVIPIFYIESASTFPVSNEVWIYFEMCLFYRALLCRTIRQIPTLCTYVNTYSKRLNVLIGNYIYCIIIIIFVKLV